MVSNTGSSSPGELLMTSSASASAVCCRCASVSSRRSIAISSLGSAAAVDVLGVAEVLRFARLTFVTIARPAERPCPARRRTLRTAMKTSTPHDAHAPRHCGEQF
jgi:hypothetical protein